MQKDGIDTSDYHYKGEVTDMPEGYKNWMKDNAERIKSAKSLPYWIKDNYVGGSVEAGFRWEEEKKKATILERAEIRHKARTAESKQLKKGGNTALNKEYKGGVVGQE